MHEGMGRRKANHWHEHDAYCSICRRQRGWKAGMRAMIKRATHKRERRRPINGE